MTKLYKVLREKDGKYLSPYQSFEYAFGKKYTCEDFDPDINERQSKGLYAVDIDGLPYAWRNLPGYVVAEVEVGGRSVEYDQFKRRYEHLEVVRIVPNDEVRELVLQWEPKVGYKLAEALYPIHPLRIVRAEKQPTEAETELLKKLSSVGASELYSMGASVGYSVWASVRDSVGASVGYSVWDSVRDSVRDSVGASVRDSVRDSVWAYISSLFPIEKWKYFDHEPGVNPFQPCIDLWHAGLVSNYDGTTWRLHAGEKAEVVHEWVKP